RGERRLGWRSKHRVLCLATSTPPLGRSRVSAMMKRRVLAVVAAVGALSVTSRDARAEFPTLPRAIESARSRAIVVAEAQAELGVANAQMAGARVSALGNP